MIDYSLFRWGKGTPRVIRKEARDRADTSAERSAYAIVDARDQHRCYWPGCQSWASDHHHIKPRSTGGAHESRNLLSACRKHHDYFKAGLVTVKGNPDRGPVTVMLTKLGRESKIRLPMVRAGRA